MRPLCLAALLSASALSFQVMTTSSGVQGGQGASAFASDPTTFLRTGPLTRMPGEPYEILQSLPPEFPLALLPEGAVPNVAAVSSSLTIVVATVKSDKPFDATQFAWKLEDSGWINTSPGMRGFSMGTGAPMLSVCRGGDFANYSFRTAANGDRMVRVSIGKEPTRSCAPMGMRPFSDVPLPILTLPPGVRSTGGGGGGGLDDTSTRARLETTMTVDQLAAHLIPQFKEAGWKLEAGPTSDGTMSVTRFIGASRAGDPVTGQLILTAFPGTPYVDALARYVRHKPVR
jgi:hypothetical protein